MANSIPILDGTAADAATNIAAFVTNSLPAADAPTQLPDKLSPPPGLIGIDDAVVRQILGALHAGKQHIMFYGPPGTGKTSIARWLASELGHSHTLITGSADWSSQDIIGGYQPVGEGKIAFVPGVLLANFDRVLVIDELNRCDIDKVIGPLFTVLSGQATQLPYRVKPEDAESDHYSIDPDPGNANETTYAPSPEWRIIATLNSIDKASLYQMSYALTRRFGWILIDVPRDLEAFLAKFIEKERGAPHSAKPLARLWAAINKTRPVGPAPIIDLIRTILIQDKDFSFLAAPTDDKGAEAYLDGFSLYLCPMLDGILKHEADAILEEAAAALGFEPGKDSHNRLKALLHQGAV